MAMFTKKPRRVLVVDDEESMQMLLMDVLSEFGYEVVCASDGKSALKKYRSEPFDLILSDLSMAPMNGLELLDEIRKVDQDVLFIMITGFPSVESSMAAIKKGAMDYITKPFNLDEIKIKLDRAFLEQSLRGRIKNIQGVVWALIISIPVWFILGIILARALR